MKQYLNSLQTILDNGTVRENRTGVNTIAVFGHQERFNLQEGFPAVTTKKLAWKSVVSELLWFLEGTGDERRLAEIRFGKPREELTDKQTIWTANAGAEHWKLKHEYEGDLGRVYGVQWRHWRGEGTPVINYKTDPPTAEIQYEEVDQIANVLDTIKNNPNDRRILLTAWNPGELDQMALPPCHLLAQFNVRLHTQEKLSEIYMAHRRTLSGTARNVLDAQYEGMAKTAGILQNIGLPTGYLDCQMYQRSCDSFLGVPFNIASYALLTHMLAHVTGLTAGDFVHTYGDLHIYENHLDQVKEQLTREPLPLPTLWLNPDVKDIDGFTMDDIRLDGYESHPAIHGDMAV